MVRLPTIATWASAMLAGIATGTNLASHPPYEDLITERSPAFDNKQVSDAINDALARAGFNAGEAAKIRNSYHVDVDQIDDNSDKSRQLLDEALSNILDKPDVKRIDAALDFLVGKLDGLVERDAETTADAKKPIWEYADVPEGLFGNPVPLPVENGPLTPRDSGKLINPANLMHNLMNNGDDLSQDAKDALLTWLRKHGGLGESKEPVHKIDKDWYYNDPDRFPKGINIEHCDCKKAIASIIEPKPEYLDWKWLKAWDTKFWNETREDGRIGAELHCMTGCADRAVSRLVNRIVWLEEHESLDSSSKARNDTAPKPLPEDIPLPRNGRPLSERKSPVNTPEKREEATDHSGPKSWKSKMPLAQNESLKSLKADYDKKPSDQVTSSDPNSGLQVFWEKLKRMGIVKPEQSLPRGSINAKDVFQYIAHLLKFHHNKVPGDDARSHPPGHGIEFAERDTSSLSRREEAVDSNQESKGIKTPIAENEPTPVPKHERFLNYRDWWLTTHENGDLCICNMDEKASWIDNILPWPRRQTRCMWFCDASVGLFKNETKNTHFSERPAPGHDWPHFPEQSLDFISHKPKPVPKEDAPGTVSVPVTVGPQGSDKNSNGQPRPGQEA
jgi:hypothetical protein